MLGDMTKSEEGANKAMLLNRQHFQALAGLGLVHFERKQYTKADECFRRCLKLNPWSSVSSRLSFCIDTLKRLENNVCEEEH